MGLLADLVKSKTKIGSYYWRPKEEDILKLGTMTKTEELSVVIKVMHLLRTGKISATSTNIEVLRLIS